MLGSSELQNILNVRDNLNLFYLKQRNETVHAIFFELDRAKKTVQSLR